MCPNCGRPHLGRCLVGSGVCYKCRQPGHLVDKCPQRSFVAVSNQTFTPYQGRVFVTNRQEAERTGTIVTGTLPILGHFALVLFDSRPSHSFISSMFVQHMSLDVEPLSHMLFVSTPSRKIMLSREKIKVCQIEIAKHVLDVTLLVLNMQDFDVILGMD